MLRYATFSKTFLSVYSKISLTCCTVTSAVYPDVLDCERRMTSLNWLTLSHACKLFCYLHLRNSNKQQLILTTIYTNNSPFIGNQIARFQLNLPMQTIATVAFVRSPQNTSSRSLWITLDTNIKLKCSGMTSQKPL